MISRRTAGLLVDVLVQKYGVGSHEEWEFYFPSFYDDLFRANVDYWFLDLIKESCVEGDQSVHDVVVELMRPSEGEGEEGQGEKRPIHLALIQVCEMVLNEAYDSLLDNYGQASRLLGSLEDDGYSMVGGALVYLGVVGESVVRDAVVLVDAAKRAGFEDIPSLESYLRELHDMFAQKRWKKVLSSGREVLDYVYRNHMRLHPGGEKLSYYDFYTKHLVSSGVVDISFAHGTYNLWKLTSNSGSHYKYGDGDKDPESDRKRRMRAEYLMGNLVGTVRSIIDFRAR